VPRGRQYYDPIVQVPGKVEGARDLSRIELYPEGGPDDPAPKWRGRRIFGDGSIMEVAPGDFDHDRALSQAQQMWPGLDVYELRSEGEDSTWEGHGPSPRLWQPTLESERLVPQSLVDEMPDMMRRELESIPPAVPEDQATLRLLAAPEPGAYVLLTDVIALLEGYARSFEDEKNPSGALALREAADVFKGIG
jgi:hypothetical protein